MITLNGIELRGLVWENELDWTGVLTEVDYSLARRPIIWEEPLPAGRPINLTGTENTGVLQRQILLDVLAIANIAGGVYVLNYNGVNYSVRFRHEDAPAVYGEPLVGREKAEGTDYYKNVAIKLMEV